MLTREHRQRFGQLAGRLDASRPAAAHDDGQQPPPSFGVGLAGRRRHGCLRRLPDALRVVYRIQRDRALGQAGDGKVMRPTAQREDHAGVRQRSGCGQQTLLGQVEAGYCGLDEPHTLGEKLLERHANRRGGARPAGNPRQLGDDLVVRVLIDQRRLDVGVLVQPAGQAQRHVQSGVACARDPYLGRHP